MRRGGCKFGGSQLKEKPACFKRFIFAVDLIRTHYIKIIAELK